MRRLLLWAAVVAAIADPSGGAGAQVQFDGDGKPGTFVRFGDLDVGREADRRLLERRVRSAVGELCGEGGERTIAIVMAIRQCQKQTLAAARKVIDGLASTGVRSNLGLDGAKLAFSSCEFGRLRISSCQVSAIFAEGTLTARPSRNAPTTLAPGFTALGDVGHVYRPPTAPEGPRPLILLLHGAGDDSRRFLEMLRPVADERGYIMAAADPLGSTWDMAAELARTRSGAIPEFGADVPRIDALLREIFARAEVGANQVVLVGYSDGAAYGLSLALANSDLFPAVVALSPGFVKAPSVVDRTQRIFIAHGSSDSVIPLESGRAIAGDLRNRGARVEFREFAGDHSLSRTMLLQGIDHALARP